MADSTILNDFIYERRLIIKKGTRPTDKAERMHTVYFNDTLYIYK